MVNQEHGARYLAMLLASSIISCVPITYGQVQINHRIEILGDNGNDYPWVNSTPTSNLTVDQQTMAIQRQATNNETTTSSRTNLAKRSIEFESPIRRILELLSHHHSAPPVIVVSSNDQNEQVARKQPASVASTSSSDQQRQWMLVSDHQATDVNSAPMLVAQQQQLMQTSIPYEQYYLATNNLVGGPPLGQQQFAMLPAMGSNQPQVLTYGQQQQPQHSPHPASAIPEQFVQQANNMGDSLQPIFLSSYAPESIQPFLSQQQQQTIGLSQPNSIQQIQRSQETADKQPSPKTTPAEQPEQENEGHSDDESAEPASGGGGGEPDSGSSSSSGGPGEADESPAIGSSGSSSYEDKYDSDKDPARSDSEAGSKHGKTDATSDSMVAKNGFVSVGLNDDCMQCICRASSGCDQQLRCITRGSEEKYCGPFQLTEEYWNLAGSPDDSADNFSSFEDCANDVDCAVSTVTNYMRKYRTDCDGDQNITCIDYARLHRLKRDECSDTDKLVNDFDAYWARFQNCAEGYHRSRTGDDEFI